VPSSDWVLLAYRLPREPSTPRIALWRKLRRLGAAQLIDGLVALPATAETIEAFDWLADEVQDGDGDAWTWIGRPGTKAQENALRSQMMETTAAEYRTVVAEAQDAMTAGLRRDLSRLRREFRRVEQRDYFASKEREPARRALERLAAVAEGPRKVEAR
jgi:hypothetical protein